MVRCSDLPVEDLTITRKILTHEKNLVELGLGKPGERVSYWYKRLARYHSKTGKPLKRPNAKLATKAVETNSGEYWSDYYVTELDEVYRSILGIEYGVNKAISTTKHPPWTNWIYQNVSKVL